MSFSLKATVLVLFATLTTTIATPVTESAIVSRAFDDKDFINPTLNGGSFLDASAGLGEPLNVIISGKSSPSVLDLAGDGFLKFANAIGFDRECLGLHIGGAQQANLGDGRGWVNETEVLRQSFGILGSIGTCLESLEGGNHFRVWQQAGTNAIFLAVSKEEDAEDHHDIVPDGYDIGRDLLVSSAAGRKVFFDITKFKLITYNTVVQNLTGLIPAGSEGINHGIAIDGQIIMLTVTQS
ncbi:hypothetical protein MKEN_00716700 [Mycena kentingensis (nom. inval.)]|nr:hypothetical protein MKEN_00716700 [Mycena kentingensis (nom. inval.)]